MYCFQHHWERSNQTLPVLIEQLIPTGVRGVITAAVLAALMSAIAAALNSIGTLVAVDIVARLRPNTSDRAQVTIGRISSVVVMLLAMAWSTQGGRYSSIFEAINAIAADLAPPITVVFLWGVLAPRHRASFTVHADFGLHHGSDCIHPGSSCVRHGEDSYSPLGDSFHDAGLVDVLYLQRHLCCGHPPDAGTCARIGGRPDLGSPLAAVTQERFEGLRDPRLIATVLAVTVAVLYYIFR